MHIEPGLVAEGKIWLSYVTSAGAGAYALKLAFNELSSRGLASLLMRSAAATAAVFCFFEVLPHHPVGVSEVHLILASTLFLLLGAAPTSIGLGLGLLLQGIYFAPFDLPQYGMNLTTLLVPLFLVNSLASRIIPATMPYVEIRYRHALALSAAYQMGVVGWVTFWALFGQGVSLENAASIMTFGTAYMLVILVEPVVDLTVLAIAKAISAPGGSRALAVRLYSPA